MSTVITIIKNDAATLMYHPDTKIVHHILHKGAHGKQFHQILNAGLEVLQEFQATKWLSDDRHAGTLLQEDRDWIFNNWFPRVVAEGWKYWAWVLPRQVDSIKNAQETAHMWRPYGLKVMYFSYPEPALLWLAKQD